jgi:hypothetical protein
MFGSQYLSDARTWFYDFRRHAWEAQDLQPHPPAQKTGTYSTIPRMAYDSLHAVALCLVWLGEEKGHETWALDTSKLHWTKLNPATEPAPSKSRSRNLSFSAALNLFILDLSTTNNRQELWTYRYQNPVPATRPTPPRQLRVVTDIGKARLSWAASPLGGAQQYHVYRAEAEHPWLATNRVEIHWAAHPAPDVTGYNLYCGIASVKTVRQGEPGAWKDNDPAYHEPKVVRVTDLTAIDKINDQPLAQTNFTDVVDLTRRGSEAADYKFTVYAYIVRAVNKLGVESAPSPYALTLPSEPLNVLCREQGDTAELKWDANPETGITGYRLYQLKGTWEILPVNDTPICETFFSHRVGRGQTTRFWVTALDALGQEGQPSSPAWFNHSYRGFFQSEWHQ